jgi:hypothetical protein
MKNLWPTSGAEATFLLARRTWIVSTAVDFFDCLLYVPRVNYGALALELSTVLRVESVGLGKG